MKTILVGYDDSTEARRALDRAIELSKAFDASLVIASVAPVMASAGRSAGPIDPADSPALHDEQLDRAATAAREAGIGTVVLVPAVGHPADTLIEAASHEHADLIVVGGRELNTVQRLLGQSTSSRVAAHAACDVLIVH